MRRNSRESDTFKHILNLYGTAEGFIKEVEVCRASVPIAAINELRYAGHHLVKGLADEDEKRFHEELDKASDHCNRSMYEASEAGIAYLLDLIKIFEDDYDDVPIIEIVPD